MAARPPLVLTPFRRAGRWLKQAFGLVTILLGVLFLTVGIGQKRWLVLLINLPWVAVFFYFGPKWLLDIVALDAVTVDPDSPEMVEAKNRARASLDRLWESLGENRHECLVRFPLRTRRGTSERVWAVVQSRTDEGVVVSLADEPYAESEDPNERMVVAIPEIEDWQVIVSESEIRGGYSFAALARIARSRGHRLSRADRRKLRTLVDAA